MCVFVCVYVCGCSRAWLHVNQLSNSRFLVLFLHPSSLIYRVGQNHIYIYIYLYIHGVRTVFLAGESPNIRSYTVYMYGSYIGLARTIYIRCTNGIFGRGITKYTVIYSVYVRFWPTLLILSLLRRVKRQAASHVSISAVCVLVCVCVCDCALILSLWRRVM